MASARASDTTRLRAAARAARERPALALYLLALATLGFKWASPLSGLHERAGWTDVFVALAAVAWLWERVRARFFPAPRAFHLALALYLAAGVLSMGFADAHRTAAENVLLMAELAVLAVLASEFTSEAEGRDATVAVVAFVLLYTVALAVVGLGLFYADVDTSFTGAYGEQFIASENYARVSAGFESSPLLASFCIFASAMVAQEDSLLSRSQRRVLQVALALLVLSTFSRGAIGFAAALAIRHGWAHRTVWARRLAVGFVVACVGLIAALTVGRLHVDPTRPSTASYEVPDPGNRREAFVTSLDTLSDHPLVGKGPGSFPGENRGQPFRAHLTPLNVAATLGLPALAALTFLFVSLWRNRRRPTPLATWSGFAGLAIDALAQDVEHFRHVWILVGVADAQRQRTGAGDAILGGRWRAG